MPDSRLSAHHHQRKPSHRGVERGLFSARPIELRGEPQPAREPRMVSGPLCRLDDPNVRHMVTTLLDLIAVALREDDRRAYPRRSRLEREASLGIL